MSSRSTERGARLRHALLLAPGTALTTTALLALVGQAAAVGGILLVIGVVFLLAYARGVRR
ncbi:hypothetical protein [Geodermatophilus sp. SYSU D01119]